MYLGELIKHFRLEHNVSQQEFADRCGLSKPYISQLENNKNPKTGLPPIPSMTTFQKVSRVTGIDIFRLLATVDENKPAFSLQIQDETESLLSYYYHLNEEGKKKLLEYAKDLAVSGRYRYE